MPMMPIDDTLDLYYEIHDFADPWNAHETVVLHAGNLKDHRLWYAWVPLLARRYRVVTLDARGHGRSSVPPRGYPWSLGGFAHDLARLLDALEIDRAHLVGETTGGLVALQFASEYPARVQTLTQCSVYFRPGPLGPTPGDAAAVEQQGLRAWAMSKMARRVGDAQNEAGFQGWYASVMAGQSQQVAIETLRYLALVDATPLLDQIRVPTLVLAAEHSETLREWAMPMHRLIATSRLEVIADTHGFVQHTAPEQCVAAWLRFVDGVEQR
jgi:pimeloyl-ACP methyl ester carboxylesterase